MVSRLSASEATPISRSERFSCSTRPNSQRSENGASASAKPRLARSSTASPAHTSLSRSSSTGTGGSAAGEVGSLMKTTLCSVLTPVSRPAVPSLNSSTTGPGVVEPHEVAPAQPHRARPHAGVLRPTGQRGGGRRRHRPACRGNRRDRAPARGSGRRRSWRAGADGSAAPRQRRDGPSSRYPLRRRCRRPNVAPAPEDRRCFRRLHPLAFPLRGMSNRQALLPQCGPTQNWRFATLAAPPSAIQSSATEGR